MNLPNDLIRIIFHHLPITDKRNLTRTCNTTQQLSDPLQHAIIDFHKMIRKTHYVTIEHESNLCKFTIELLHDGYTHLIPKRYITKKNVILSDHGVIFNSARRGQKSVLKLLMKCAKKFLSETNSDCALKEITNGCANGGHLKLLRWASNNGCILHSFTSISAASNGHLKVLQWAIKHGCAWDKYVCGHAAVSFSLIINDNREIHSEE